MENVYSLQIKPLAGNVAKAAEKAPDIVKGALEVGAGISGIIQDVASAVGELVRNTAWNFRILFID